MTDYHKQYYQKNRDKILRLARERYDNNKEHIKEYAKQYYQNNKGHKKQYYQNNREKELARNRKWWDNHKEYNRQWHINNKEQHKEYDKRYRQNNKDKLCAYSANRRALKLNQTPKDADLKLIAQIYAITEYMNTISTDIKWSVDHIIPLIKGGEHHQDNLKIMELSSNISKYDKMDLSIIDERINNIRYWEHLMSNSQIGDKKWLLQL